MYHRSLSAFVSYSFGFAIISVIVFAAMRFLNISTGQFIDWIVGVLSCWWLLLIVTVPWNIFFEAKDLINEAKESKSANIRIDEAHVKYAHKIAGWALVSALSLHIVSAVALFALSALGITPVGQVASAAALLLTGLRPVVRGYEHLHQKLNLIKQRVKYPREDVVELRGRVEDLQNRVRNLEEQMDTHNPSSFVAQINRSNEDVRQRLGLVTSQHQQAEIDHKLQHEILMRESRDAISKVSQDIQFLDHVREIVRLIKSA
jgi:hypothetical protein